jgi:hypothetical protein
VVTWQELNRGVPQEVQEDSGAIFNQKETEQQSRFQRLHLLTFA